MATLWKLGSLIEAIDEGEEVGRVEEQAAQIESESRDGVSADVTLDGAELIFVNSIHVVPESLAGELRGRSGNEPSNERLGVPLGQAGLATWSNAPVQSSQKQVVANRRTRRTPLGNMSIDDRDHIQRCGDIEASSGGAKLADLDGLGVGPSDSFDQPLGRSEVIGPDDFRFSVDALTLAEIVVGLAVDDLLRQARHLGHTTSDTTRLQALLRIDTPF